MFLSLSANSKMVIIMTSQLSVEQSNDPEIQIKEFTVDIDVRGQRLDQVIVSLLPDYSRSRLQQWLKKGKILVDGVSLKGKTKLKGGESICVTIELEQQGQWQAEPIPLDIIYEDETLLVINKPVGLVVHPAVGNQSGTLLNALLHHCPDLINVPRAGIVHRIDKDTSGLLVVAKTLTAQTHLVNQLQQRAFEREYEAIALGEMISGGCVDEAIGRHPTQRVKMAVMKNPNNGKEAITHYRIKQKYRSYTHLTVKLETGRTHQIRVHMAYINAPLVGDQTYGGRLRIPADCSAEFKQFLHDFRRQALHARKLGLIHPQTGEWIDWEVERPDDLQQLLFFINEYTQAQE